MDWQQIAALAIVGITAIIFLWGYFRRRQTRVGCENNCGCASAPRTSPPSPVIYRARKGEGPQIIVKNR